MKTYVIGLLLLLGMQTGKMKRWEAVDNVLILDVANGKIILNSFPNAGDVSVPNTVRGNVKQRHGYSTNIGVYLQIKELRHSRQFQIHRIVNNRGTLYDAGSDGVYAYNIYI